ncbi:MAG: hypothetical protein MUC62_07055 [Candidatus Thermoplasmatota archaeon]|nr:hypothetical protein [Candidatus Thermoplasmatota archaeon]
MRSSLYLVLLVLLITTSFHAAAGGSGGHIGPSRSGYDIDYLDLTVPQGEVFSFVNVTVLVRRTLYVLGKLELVNSTVILVEEETATHRVYGTLKMMDGPDDGSGSCLEFRHPRGNTDVLLSNGALESVNSTLINLTLEFGDISMTGSHLINCTIYKPVKISRLTGNVFSNGSDRAALDLSATNWEIAGNTIRDYDRGILTDGGGLKLSSVTFDGCPVSVLKVGSDGMDELRLDKVKATNSSFSVSKWGAMVVMGGSFKGGRIDLMGRPGYFQSTTFLDHQGIYQLKDGLVNDCTFMNSSIGLDVPLNSTILRNRFLNCGTALRDDRDCTIFHNIFKGNDRIVEGFVQSLWYNSTFKEGNFYDSYTGLDNGLNGRQRDDGIGDTDLPFMGRDYYPLLKEYYWLFPKIPDLTAYHELGGSSIRLSWDFYRNIGYVIQCSQTTDFKKMVSVYSASSSPLKVNAPGNGTYHFRVSAWNEQGSRGWSGPTTVLVDQRPLPPLHLTAEPLPDGQEVLVSWEWEGEDLYSGTIYYSTEEGDEELGPPVSHPIGSTVIGGLENGRTYRFSMTSKDNRGQVSMMSEQVTAMPMDTIAPPPPTSVSASPMDNTAIAIQWNPPSDIYYPDLSGFLLYRMGPEDDGFGLLRSFQRGVLYYEDEGLKDNTTYHYQLRSVDDDGPVSGPSQTVQATTFHYNLAPVFLGGSEVIYLKEDDPPSVLDVIMMFKDPDGDRLMVSVTDSFPFASEMKEGLLHLYQEPDQSGNGYIQLVVTDGEAFETFLLGVFIEPSDDAPTDIAIISPVNGSVLVPGTLTLLEGYAFDPDMRFEGDILTFKWSSDRDGVLSGPGISVSRMRAQLSGGSHRINLTVTDSKGFSISSEVIVMVSLWGWGVQPWYIELDNTTVPLSTSGGSIRFVLVNDGPLFLTFDCTVTMRWGSYNLTMVRNILSPPMDRGLMVINAPPGLTPGIMYLEVEVSAFTLNGSFAGYSDALFEKEVTEERVDGMDSIAILLIGGATLMVLVVAAVYLTILIITKRNERGKRPYGAEDVGGGGSG